MFGRSKPFSPKSHIRLFFKVATPVRVVIALFAFSHAALACTTPGSLIGGFDRETSVFLGKVMGYSTPAKYKASPTQVFGLRIEVTHAVFPAVGPNQYIVYPTRRMADCSEGGFGIDSLKAKYPIGSEVRVIGRFAESIETDSFEHTTLESGARNHTSLSLNPPEKSQGRSSVGAEFEYSLANNTFLNSAADRFDFVAFEVQKDLVRLEQAKTRAERKSILNRLKNAPEYALLSFELIEATYDTDKPTDKRKSQLGEF